jgi:phage terminase large subunit-like protein
MTSGTKRTSFLRYRLGIWAQADNRWFHGSSFADCRKDPPAQLEGRPCVVGIDIASHLDMTAAAFLFKADDGSWDCEMRYWCPEETIADRERKDNIPYSTWVREGWLIPTQGARLDHEAVAREILAMSETYRIVRIGSDPWQVGLLATLLEKHDLKVQAVAQNTRTLSEPCKMLDGLVAEGRFRYRSPILLFNANNVCLYVDTTDMVKPDKAKSSEQIDGISATVVAFAMAIGADEELSAPDADQWRIQVL